MKKLTPGCLASFIDEELRNVLLGEKVPLDISDSQTMEVIIPANRKITATLIRQMVKRGRNIEIDPSPVRRVVLERIERAYERHAKASPSPTV